MGTMVFPLLSPWGTNYENGIVPPSHMFNGTEYAKYFPNGIFPNDTPLHPTPIYEFLASLLIFLILWKFRKRNWTAGKLVMLYFILSSLSRFLVEFIRLNPRILMGLSQAQIISIVIFTIGMTGFIYLTKQRRTDLEEQ